MPIDIGSLSTLTGSLQSAVQLLRAMVGVRDGALLQEKVIELQQVIMAAQANALSAQEDQFALRDRVRDLEAQIANITDWQTERQKYKLEQVSEGAFAYILTTRWPDAEPPHWLCTSCFENGIKSLLQNQGLANNKQGPIQATYKCGRCSETIKVPFGLYPGRR